MTFGEKLRKSRINKGLTQLELAKLAGLGLNTISNYEKGKTYPQNREIYKILANLLDVNADYLHNENDDFISDAATIYGSKGLKEAQNLINEFSGLFAGGSLSEHDKDAVMRTLQEIYWECKKENVKKFTPKKYKNSDENL